jgi:glycosyltransferase involved in cell wall biosynthesis
MTSPLVSVITATIGRPALSNCIQSIFNQTYQNYQHLIVIDGQEHKHKVDEILQQVPAEALSKIDVLCLPYPRKQYGGPIYACSPVISKGDYICNLDDDNTYETSHIKTCLDSFTSGIQWVFSLRNIMTYGKFICQDNCESLGNLHPIWSIAALRKEQHIDTSCYFLPRYISVAMAPFWCSDVTRNTELAVINDRVFHKAITATFPNYKSTLSYTVNYEVNPEGKIDINYFHQGNAWMIKTYNTQTPWIKNVKT